MGRYPSASTPRARRSGAWVNRILHLHAAALEPDEVVAVDGLAVTSIERTLVDLARARA